MADFVIRQAILTDAVAVAEVHTQAFGRPDEGRLVEALSASEAFVPELSLVAEHQSQVVGHILLTHLRIGSSPGLALAPVAVLPAWQRRGIGKQLTHASLAKAAELGHRVVVVLGHPGLYAACGFEPALPRGIEAPFPLRDTEAWRVIGLVPDAFQGVRGLVEYPPAWGVLG